jgi:hypothetical protein
MSTRAVVQPYPPAVIDGRAHLGFEIQAEGPLGATPELFLSFVIDRVPVYFTITLIEAFLTEGSTFALWLGTEPDGDAPWDTIASLAATDALRHQTDLRVVAPCRRLYGRATFAASPPLDAFRLRLVLVDAHM